MEFNLRCISSDYSIPFSEFYKMEKVPPISEIDKIEIIAGKILKSKTLKRIVIISAVVILNSAVVSAAGVIPAGAGVDNLFNVLMAITRKWAKYVLIITCLINTIRSGISGDSKNVLSIVMKYVLLYLLLFLVPALFGAIEASGIN